MLSKLTARFERAKYFGGRAGVPVRFVVLHSIEGPETNTQAEAMLAWFGRFITGQASTHYSVDCDSITASVDETQAAWAVGDIILNRGSISIEQAGRASQTRAQWLDAYSSAMITLSARLTADLLSRYGIPARLSIDEDIRDFRANPGRFPASRGGIITHGQITRALGKRGGHTDPGPDYPLDVLLQRVRDAQGGTRTTTANAATCPAPTRGTRWAVHMRAGTPLKTGPVGSLIRHLHYGALVTVTGRTLDGYPGWVEVDGGGWVQTGHISPAPTAPPERQRRMYVHVTRGADLKTGPRGSIVAHVPYGALVTVTGRTLTGYPGWESAEYGRELGWIDTNLLTPYTK